MIEITTPDGRNATAIVNRFPALEGWEIQNDFIRFSVSDDKEFKKQFTLRVLSYVVLHFSGDHKVQLKTSALIDNHLGTWENLRDVFNAVLSENGIDPETHAVNQVNLWAQKFGDNAAISFYAKASELLAPAFAAMIPSQKSE